MAAQIPKITRGWEINDVGKKTGDLEILQWKTDLPVADISPTDVLVKFHAVALNWRDISLILKEYPLPVRNGVVPGADGAGEVIAVGSRVSRHKIGDRVLPFLFQTGFFGGQAPSPEAVLTAHGAAVDGVFREYALFNQEVLVTMPSHLSYEEGAAIQGPFLTAWNSLTGGAVKLQLGDCVLVQGSGIVSLAAIQLAAASGAVVIATTSSDEKGEKMKRLGARHVINYTQDKEWGSTAKKLSPRGLGCKFVLDVVGEPDSFRQSLEAIAPGGEISAVGFLATAATAGQVGPSFMETLVKPCTVRGIQVGTRQQLEEVCYALEVSGVRPMYDDHTFELEDLRAAYKYLMDRKNFGKVTVSV